MLNKVREIVSGPKNRYKDEGFNLDLSYITPRIIAMSLPGEWVTSTYRNNLGDVAKFLHQKHGNRYIIINLSQKTYDYSKFGNRVIDFPWIDHHAPYLPVLFDACVTIHEFLKRRLYYYNRTYL